MKKQFFSLNEEDTQTIAQNLAETFKGGEVVCLYGDVGSGKTAFTKGLAKQLGIDETVLSPTFTIMQHYQGAKFSLYHFDMYRIIEENELCETGFFEALDSGQIVVIEWPQNISGSLPEKLINVTINSLDNLSRGITIEYIGY